MRKPLRILSIEDDPKDSKLIQDLLETEESPGTAKKGPEWRANSAVSSLRCRD